MCIHNNSAVSLYSPAQIQTQTHKHKHTNTQTHKHTNTLPCLLSFAELLATLTSSGVTLRSSQNLYTPSTPNLSASPAIDSSNACRQHSQSSTNTDGEPQNRRHVPLAQLSVCGSLACGRHHLRSVEMTAAPRLPENEHPCMFNVCGKCRCKFVTGGAGSACAGRGVVWWGAHDSEETAWRCDVLARFRLDAVARLDMLFVCMRALSRKKERESKERKGEK